MACMRTRTGKWNHREDEVTSIIKICRKKEFKIKAKKVCVLNVPYKHVVLIWKGRISSMHMLLICLNSSFDNLFSVETHMHS